MPIDMALPPMPVPDRLQGARVVAEFDVDEKGRVITFDFTPTADRDYNKKLREAFRGYRFRPGTRPDGTPIRMKAQVSFDL
jgi:periplasmic protein TonB